jgi:DNA polymerase-3 subunit delta
MKILVETKSNTLIDKTINEIAENSKIEFESIFYFDFENEEDLNNAVAEYLATSLLEDKKLIVIRNFDAFRIKAKPSVEVCNKLSHLFELETDNVFVFIAPKLNVTNITYKEYEDKITLFQLVEPEGKELKEFIKNFLKNKNVNIDAKAIDRLIEITESSFDNIVNELRKISLLSDNVDKELINKITYNRKGESMFKLIDSIFKKDVQSISGLIDKMQTQDIAVFAINNLLIGDIV